MPIKPPNNVGGKTKSRNNKTGKQTINGNDTRKNQNKQQTIPMVITTPVARSERVARKNA